MLYICDSFNRRLVLKIKKIIYAKQKLPKRING